jgi:hypothetical protein
VIVLTAEDVTYIVAGFVPLQELCAGRERGAEEVRRLIAQRRLPHPSYTLDDGTPMVGEDYFGLLDEAGPDRVEAMFRERYAAAARALGVEATEELLAEEFEDYLTGAYGVCLHRVTPENICAKGFHMRAIEALLDAPRPDDAGWRSRLAGHVEVLDALERPFAPCDRVRWGPVSRDRLITASRESYPQAFTAAPG